MTKDEALKRALEALMEHGTAYLGHSKEYQQAIIKSKEALTQPEPESAAWRTCDGEGGYDYRSYENNEQYANEFEHRNPQLKGWVEPLYTTPPAREWVGLTDDERNAIESVTLGLHGIPSFFATAIEAKLKELNHG